MPDEDVFVETTPLPPSAAYDVLPYEDYPIAEAHLDTLCFAARRAGVSAVDPERARVLELGCAHAVHLMPMAFHLPEASFVGIDLAPRQIERATERAHALGLTNLELHCADVMDLPLDGQRFDFIIAHGLYSWVPEPVRERVFALCRASLNEHGIAYVSYNAMPAWGIRGAIRQALLEGVAEATSVAERLHRARATLDLLESVQPLCGSPEGALLASEIEGLREKSDAYLLHEYLSPHSQAFYLREVVERAARAGLRYLGDVAPSPLGAMEQLATRAALREVENDVLRCEQLFDIVSFRQFRASLWCRSEAPIQTEVFPRGLLETSHLTANSPHPDTDDSEDVPAALVHLRRCWPGDVAFAELASTLGIDPTDLVTTLWPLVLAQQVQVRTRRLPIGRAGAYPEVTALSRFEAKHLPFVTNPRHEVAPLDAFHAALIHHLDGRHTRPQLVEALLEDIRAERLRLQGPRTPSPAQLRSALEALVDGGLQRLEAAALLVG